MIRVYLDICCLKRPFDDPAHERIRLEADAVLAILAAPPQRIVFVHSGAHDLENDQNPVAVRAARVRAWLDAVPLGDTPDAELESRVSGLVALGFGGFDALHVASAEILGAEILVTCDDKLLAAARRQRDELRVRVVDPIACAGEVLT